MRHHHVTRVLPFTPDQLFELVGEVGLYPEFVPWITSMRVRPVRAEPDGSTVVDAEASVGFAVLNERFSTRVLRDPQRREITVELISGPFRKLLNRWKFRPHPQGCEVVFDNDFEFKSKLLDMLLAANFNHAVERLMGCFEARAKKLYGAPALEAAPAAG